MRITAHGIDQISFRVSRRIAVRYILYIYIL